MNDNRSKQRRRWVSAQLSEDITGIDSASADASFRSYWRVRTRERSYVLMDAPPEKEDCRPFLAIQRVLRDGGVHAPKVYAFDLDQGFILLEDMGDTLYADRLNPDTVDRLYGEALSALGKIARLPTAGIPPYDRERLTEEMSLFPDWYVQRQLGVTVDDEFRGWWEPLMERLVQNAFEQPQVFVHRDYHCGNLMVCDDPPGVLDFQDAVRGPLTYDLVSLLLDRYITWPRTQLVRWAGGFRERHAPNVDAATWIRWFDLMGLQRNLKVVGIFARLNLRDGKPRYLQWQPRFLGYVRDIAERYDEFEPLARFLAAIPPATAS